MVAINRAWQRRSFRDPQSATLGSLASGGLTALTYLMVIHPVFGIFYPFQSYLANGSDEEVSIGIPLMPMTLLLVSGFVGLLYILISKTRTFNHNWLAYLFVFIAFASVTWSGNPGSSAQRALRLLPAIGLGIVFAQFYTLRQMMKIMVTSLIVAGVLSIAISILLPNFGLARLGHGYENAWRGANIHKNGAGFLFSIGIMICIYGYFLGYVSLVRTCIAGFLCCIMAVMANSATAIICMLGGLATGGGLFVISHFPRRQRFPLIIMMISFIIVGGGLLVANLDSLLGATGRDMSLTGRTAIWEAVIDRIMERPLTGYGYAFWVTPSYTRAWIWQYVGDKAAHSHNSWLDIWIQLGIFGLLSFVAIVLVTITKAIKLIVNTDDKRPIFCMSVLVFLCIRSVSEVQFTDPLLTAAFWMFWMAATLRQIEIEHSSEVEERMRNQRKSARVTWRRPVPRDIQ